jgi:hypothetical protein
VNLDARYAGSEFWMLYMAGVAMIRVGLLDVE